jgi:hypothetical protein
MGLGVLFPRTRGRREVERELWERLCLVVSQQDTGWTNGFYRAGEVVAVYLWAVVHDRPTSWACDERNWHGLTPAAFPPQCTMSRRLRSRGVIELLKRVEEALGEDPRRCWLKWMDSKPLPIGSHSKDRDARVGRAGKGFALGYKVHVILGAGPIPSKWRVEPMNTGDAVAARKLVKDLSGEGYLVGDRQFDSNPLHEAASPAHQVVAGQQRPGKNLGHRPHHPGRVHALEMLGREFGKAVLATRGAVERLFGNLTNCAAGLSPLPSWVRRQHRVELWVQAKLLIHAVRSSRPSIAPA